MLRRLNKILAQPEYPMYAIGDWSAVEYAIGTTLPSDYKKFITAYGAGYIGNQFFLQIHNPFVWTALGRDIRKS